MFVSVCLHAARQAALSAAPGFGIFVVMQARRYSTLDRLVITVDHGLRTVFGKPPSDRASPAEGCEEAELTPAQRRDVGGLMRINHAGEVCAQALYQGQALTARLPEVRQRMEMASQEENDHLVWCEQRLQELGTHTSRLNPLWYAGSFAIGAVAGLIGDKWSLGFVAETERQVVRHLDGHLEQLPEQDRRSRAIIEQMKIDEARHATVAVESGGTGLPDPAQKLMTLTSKIMTRAAYWI